jgi:hypothetical protein
LATRPGKTAMTYILIRIGGHIYKRSAVEAIAGICNIEGFPHPRMLIARAERIIEPLCSVGVLHIVIRIVARRVETLTMREAINRPVATNGEWRRLREMIMVEWS